MFRMSEASSAFSLVELIVAIAISAIGITAGTKFYLNFSEAKRRAAAAGDAELQMDAFEKLFRARWYQRERPLDPVKDMPGEFTATHPGFLWNTSPAAYTCNRNTISWRAACYAWSTNMCRNIAGTTTSNDFNCAGLALLVSGINNADQRFASWHGVRNVCQTPSSLAKFNYFQNSSNPCRCATSPANRSRVNTIVFNDVNGRQISFPSDLGNSVMQKTHSFTACFSWNPRSADGNLAIDLEAGYVGVNNQIMFSRKKISLPIKMPDNTGDSIQR